MTATAILGSDDALAQGRKKKGSATGQTTTTETTTTTTSSNDWNNTSRFTYFPSAKTDDGRMLSIAGAGLQSLSGDAIEFGIGLPFGVDSVRLDIFDGETGGIWDLGTTPLVFEMYADPSGEGIGSVKLAEWSGAGMKDNDWTRLVVKSAAEAKSDDGTYFYRFIVRMSDPTQKSWSNFKIRTNGTAMLMPRAFSFAVPLFTSAEARVLYPSYPLTTSTTYDGTWTFNMDVASPVEDIEIWDGDMDYGSMDGLKNDSDDPDTPNDVLPDWATGTAAVAEGDALGSDFVVTNLLTGLRSLTKKVTGAPADDNINAYYRRSPAVEYDLVDPSGIVYKNANPSGNLEWERFRISTIASETPAYDHLASLLPAGVYSITMRGMDVGNLNAWRMWYNLLGTTKNGTVVGGTTTGSDSGTTDSDGTTTTGGTTTTDGTNSGFQKGNYKTMPVVVGVTEDGLPADLITPQQISIGGTGTIGYWKNHEEMWPVNYITLGNVTYSQEQAIEMLGFGGDKPTLLAKQLIAAKLNVMVGNNSDCIMETIIAADAWLIANPIGCANPLWSTGEPMHDQLDAYNNGMLPCAQHRGSVN